MENLNLYFEWNGTRAPITTQATDEGWLEATWFVPPLMQ